MSERAHLNKSESIQGKPREAQLDGDGVIQAAQQLWVDARAELYGTPTARQKIKDQLNHLAKCGEHPSVNTPLPAVLQTLDYMENRINGTKSARDRYGLPKVSLTYDNTDRPMAEKDPVGLVFARTESSPRAALHQMLPFLRIEGSAYQVPRSVPGGSGDACVPERKPHGRSLGSHG